MMKLALKSDFWDYYDCWFDTNPCSFSLERNSKGGMGRLAQLDYMKSLGYVTPPYGKVEDIYKRVSSFDEHYASQMEVVVYLCPSLHRGDGKVKMSLKDALVKCPLDLASVFIRSESKNNRSCSWRMLQVGDIQIGLEYTSSDWRSNCGDDVQITVLDIEKGKFHERIHLPIFAIDMIPCFSGDMEYVVDFNIAPQIKGTGVEALIEGKEIVEAIKRTYKAMRGDPY